MPSSSRIITSMKKSGYLHSDGSDRNQEWAPLRSLRMAVGGSERRGCQGLMMRGGGGAHVAPSAAVHGERTGSNWLQYLLIVRIMDSASALLMPRPS